MDMTSNYFTFSNISKLFDLNIHKTTLLKAEELGHVPKAERFPFGKDEKKVRGWDMQSIIQIGEKYGFIKKNQTPLALAIFTAKGGVLKSSLSLNIGRVFALHNIKVCVVGLDMQMDISNALGLDAINEDSDEDLDEIDKKMDSVDTLYDVFYKDDIFDVIQKTDIPTLDYIPESSALTALADLISNETRREYWLKENVVDKLKKEYDLILLDCSPNWNQLVTNALTACDILVSPIECKVNHYRNFKHFSKHLQDFKEKMHLKFKEIYVPVRYTSTRKLSTQIKRYYFTNVGGCTNTAIRESNIGEEAMASSLSMQEFKPSSIPAEEMKELLMELNDKIIKFEQSKLQSDITQ